MSVIAKHIRRFKRIGCERIGSKNELWLTILDDSSTIVKCVDQIDVRRRHVYAYRTNDSEKTLTQYLEIHMKLSRFLTPSPNDTSTWIKERSETTI